MRKDMNRVLTERPRVGGDDGQKHERTYKHKLRVREKQYYKDIEIDDRPTKESMRKRHDRGGASKSFSDHIKPLERFLLSRVGQPWNKVWSEICEVLKGTSLQANHVKDHVKGYVGGIPHSGQKYFAYNEWWNPRRSLVWVDENGILRRGERRRRLRAKDLKKTYDHVRESDLVEYHKINGCWYRVEIRMWDPIVSKPVPVFHSKKALSRREAKKLDLENRSSKVPSLIKL